jgi:hypothetical protein
VGIDTAEDSTNDANRPETHTTRMVIAPTIQTVATKTPPRGFMGPGTVSAIQSALTLHDYTDFLRRINWKMYQKKNRVACVGNYFSTIDTNA